MSLIQGILGEPPWLILWVGWLAGVNLAALAFWEHREARLVFWTLAASAVFMTVLCEVNGYNKLLGLPHVLFWTPLLAWLAPRLRTVDRGAAFGKWLFVLVLTNGVSLLIDYVDVATYVAGMDTGAGAG